MTARTDAFLSDLEKAFEVTPEGSRRIIADFQDEMRRGLEGSPGSLKMIPTFVRRPSGKEAGKFLAIDLGGTNFRVLAVTLDGSHGARLVAASKYAVSADLQTGAGTALFDFFAKCVAGFFEEHSLGKADRYDLAFTFSFPVNQTGIDSGTLMHWTKGFTASGVEGRDVVALLGEAIRRAGLSGVRVAALVNDTVGTLMAGAYSETACDMGVILGTGTNACYPEQVTKIGKMKGLPKDGEMIINIEWGNFNSLPSHRYDNEMDGGSHNAGEQRFEKMVSGMYLGEIARRVVFDMIGRGMLPIHAAACVLEKEFCVGSEHLSMLAAGGDCLNAWNLDGLDAQERQVLRQALDLVGRVVSTRSARLSGTAIAAVIGWMDPEMERDHVVAVDGSLFEKFPGYRDNVAGLLYDVLGGRAARIKLKLVKDGSGIGAAIAGAVAATSR